jgi:hypothetical protein
MTAPNKVCAICAYIKEKPPDSYSCPMKGRIKTQEVFSHSCNKWASNEESEYLSKTAVYNAKYYLKIALQEMDEVRHLSDKNNDVCFEIDNLIKNLEDLSQ